MDNLDLISALHNHFGFPDFRPGQREAVEHILARRNTLVVMPTGSGKSLCFQFPALLLDATTLVISPLIALMKDQVDALVARGKAATFINSTLSSGEQRERLVSMAQGQYRIVYLAPERLHNNDFVGALSHARIGFVAVDEAHCISQWGHDFRPDYLSLSRFLAGLGRPPVIALTATATPQVQDDIVRQLALDRAERIVTGFNRPNLRLAVRYTPSDDAKLSALETLLSKRASSIVYAGTRREAEQVAAFVRSILGISAAHYHAGLEDAERTEVQDAFMRDKITVIAATNAFGMGVDKPDIRRVIHYNLPASVEAYYQEIGRAGRDGKPARGVLLYSPKDRALQEWFIENDAPTVAQVQSLYRLLPRGVVEVSINVLQRQSGLYDTKLRVGLSQLEAAGALRRLGDEHGAMLLEVIALDRLDLSASQAQVERHREWKRKKLAQMVQYAETNHCRRRFILDYFGDHGSADAPECCDNHVAPAPEPKAAQAGDQVALTILECVRAFSARIGRSGIGKILTGSQAKDVARFSKNPFYGRLAHFTQSQLEEMVDALIQKGYTKVVGGEYPVVALTPLGQSALSSRAAIPIPIPQSLRTANPEIVRAERRVGTVELTLQMFIEGVSPSEIARRRGVRPETIYQHLADLIRQGRIEIGAVVTSAVQAQVKEAMAKATAPGLTAIKSLLPATVTYSEIRCVIAARDREREGPLPPKPSPTEEDRPLEPEEQGVFEALRRLRTELARSEAVPPFVVFNDSTLRALARARPSTLEELERVRGIGPSKQRKYGARVLAVLQEQMERRPRSP